MKSNYSAAIFDMDGVIIDNMKYHELAFYEFGKRNGVEITPEFFYANITGSTNEKIMPKIFGNSISDSEIARMAIEKESIYRELYLPNMKAADGLLDFLAYLHSKNVGMAIASNAPKENIFFIIEALKLQKYFKYYLNGTDVEHPKPAPDMFLKSAKLLGADAVNSVVFEDAPGGIRAAKSANMLAVALLTSHQREELINADLYVDNFLSKEIYSLF